MKKLFTIFALSLSFALFVASNVRAEDSATIEQLQGEVFVQAAGSAPDQWQPATEKGVVKSGDTVRTGKGTCALIYGNQATFKVTENTTFTLQNTASTQDIWLKLGKLQAKVNKSNVIKPFQVVTPVAVGSVRGTDVDFEFTEEGGFTADLHDEGPVQVFNEDTDLSLNLANTKKVTIKFNKETGELTVTNDCASSGSLSVSIGGVAHSLDACGSQTFKVNLETASGETNTPGTGESDEDDNETTPNENDEQTPPANIPDSISDSKPGQET